MAKFAVLQRIAHMVKVEQAVLVFHNVQAGCADLAAFQPGDQCITVDQLAAAVLMMVTPGFMLSIALVSMRW